jgi:hypothetical protein
MGGLRKKAHKLVGKSAQVLDPIQYNLYGKKGLERVSNFTSENVWQDPVAPVAPTEITPTVMPTADDEQLLKARRRRAAAAQARSGRASTVLTETDSLGG